MNVFSVKPIKDPFQWEDEEPYSIQGLIKDYESEEIEMKKDKLWAKFKIREELESWCGVEGGIDEDGINYVLNIIDQLDEPEVLSQEWVDNNVIHVRGLGDIVEAESVENIIMPKQELPVIPKYVGEFIEEVKASGDSLDDAYSILRGIYHQSKVADWVAKEKHNSEIFARAWLDGYEVEEEPLYYALIKGHELVNDEGEWSTKYWNLWVSDGCVFPHDKGPHTDDFLTTMSKEEWGKWGINDSNADFVKVGEV